MLRQNGKRDFKKSVDAIGGAVYNEMMIAYYNIDGADKNAIAASIEKVLAAVAKAKDNANGKKGMNNSDEPCSWKGGLLWHI